MKQLHMNLNTVNRYRKHLSGYLVYVGRNNVWEQVADSGKEFAGVVL